MKSNKIQKLALYVPILMWTGYTAWWLLINYTNGGNPESAVRDNFTDTYSLVALTGGIAGLMAAKKWGLFKSKFGKAIGFFSVGLILQFLGHFIYALYYRIGEVELAFPSVGDVPFLLTGVFYLLAIYNLLKVIVPKGNLFKPRIILAISIVATIGVGWLAYDKFLYLGIHDERGVIYSLVNVAYPAIQAFYFLLGIVAVMQARRITGGKMFVAVCVMLIALIVQYLADFSFLYQSYNESWQAAGTNDLVYLWGYGLMALSILLIDRVRLAVIKPVQQNEVEASNE